MTTLGDRDVGHGGHGLAWVPGGSPSAQGVDPVPGRVRLARQGPIGRLLRSRAATLGLVILGVVILLAVIGPYIAPYNPIEGRLSTRLLPPSPTYPLGTDGLGRDVLSRLLHGARVALQVGLLTVSIAGAVGTTL